MSENIKHFRISNGARILSSFSSLVLGTGLVFLWATSSYPKPMGTLAVIGVILFLSLIANFSNFGDRLELDGEKLVFYNVFLRKVLKSSGKTLLWSNMSEALLHKKKTLFLYDQAGKRHVFDSVGNFEEFKEEIFKYVTPKEPVADALEEDETPDNADAESHDE